MDSLAARFGSLPFTVERLSEMLGGEVAGFDLRNLRPGEQIDAIKSALREYQVLAFHNQCLSPAELVAFVRKFGEPQHHLLKQWRLPAQPEIYVLSNIVEDGRQIGNANEGLSWHTDLSGGNPQEKTTVYTILYGLTVPEVGGDTNFANMYKAYELLPEERQRQLDELVLIRSYEAQYNNRIKRLDEKGIKHDFAPLNEEQLATASKRLYQPIVDTNPHNQRKFLRLTGSGCIGIEGMPVDEGLELVASLFKHCTGERFRYAYKWRQGDVLIWDNYGLFHRAGEYEREKYRRLIYRCSIGEEDVHQTESAPPA